MGGLVPLNAAMRKQLAFGIKEHYTRRLGFRVFDGSRLLRATLWIIAEGRNTTKHRIALGAWRTVRLAQRQYLRDDTLVYQY